MIILCKPIACHLHLWPDLYVIISTENGLKIGCINFSLTESYKKHGIPPCFCVISQSFFISSIHILYRSHRTSAVVGLFVAFFLDDFWFWHWLRSVRCRLPTMSSSFAIWLFSFRQVILLSTLRRSAEVASRFLHL